MKYKIHIDIFLSKKENFHNRKCLIEVNVSDPTQITPKLNIAFLQHYPQSFSILVCPVLISHCQYNLMSNIFKHAT